MLNETMNLLIYGGNNFHGRVGFQGSKIMHVYIFYANIVKIYST